MTEFALFASNRRKQSIEIIRDRSQNGIPVKPMITDFPLILGCFWFTTLAHLHSNHYLTGISFFFKRPIDAEGLKENDLF